MWETDIDYVPRISDVDIHIKLLHSRKKILTKENPLNQSLFLSKFYETNFNQYCLEKNYEPVHLPRVQIVQLDFHGRKGFVVPPREQDIFWIQGKGTFAAEMDLNLVIIIEKRIFLNELLFILYITETLFELSQLDYYTLLYKLNSRISPTPIRLLSQVLNDNPHDLWALNKTSVKRKLLESGYHELATHYENYYLNGWKLFEKNFISTDLYLEMIQDGYFLLKNCYDEIIKLS